MEFHPELTRGRLLKRYKRFLADVRLDDGREITVHCPNPGAMTGCAEPGWEVALSHSDDVRRKLPYTLEMVHNGSVWIGVNTQRANQIVAEALAAGTFAELGPYRQVRAEVRYGSQSRVDFVLDGPEGDVYLEVKSVTLRLGDSLAFPDSVTARGRRHLDELAQIRSTGQRAVLLYVLQRADGDGFRLAEEIDPAYAESARAAAAAGVEQLILRAELNPRHWRLSGVVSRIPTA